MFVSFFKWLQETDLFSYLRNSAYAYPVLLSVHIVALIFLGGMVVVTDLRLLGLGMRSYSVSEVVNGLSRSQAVRLHLRRDLWRPAVWRQGRAIFIQ